MLLCMKSTQRSVAFTADLLFVTKIINQTSALIDIIISPTRNSKLFLGLFWVSLEDNDTGNVWLALFAAQGTAMNRWNIFGLDSPIILGASSTITFSFCNACVANFLECVFTLEGRTAL